MRTKPLNTQQQKDKQTMQTQTDTETSPETPPSVRVDNWANKYNISANFEFIPFSLSRNAGEKFPSLNWKVTLYKDQREIMRFDYSQGSGHAPSYNSKVKATPWEKAQSIKRECETGQVARMHPSGISFPGKKIAPPSLADVLYSISMDADAIDYATFEDWASEFGYEKDSRKAETIYRTCLEYGLKLRAAVGDKALAELRDAASEM